MSQMLLKVPEVAEMLGLSQVSIWRWVGQRRFEVVRLGRSVFVPKSEIDRVIEEGTTPALRSL